MKDPNGKRHSFKMTYSTSRKELQDLHTPENSKKHLCGTLFLALLLIFFGIVIPFAASKEPLEALNEDIQKNIQNEFSTNNCEQHATL